MSRPIIGSGIVLGAASIIGFISSAVFSVLLEKTFYGQLVTIFTAASIVSLAIPFGINNYLISNKHLYHDSKNFIILFPTAIATLLGLGTIIFKSNILSATFAATLIAGTVSIMGAMACQIEIKSTKAALYQSLQSIVKFLAAASLITAAQLTIPQNKAITTTALIFFGILASAIALFHLVDIRNVKSLAHPKIIKSLTTKDISDLVFFWTSSMLGIFCSIGIIPLISYTQGYEHAAYLGIYFIIWSGGNILITSAINNHYWPIINSHNISTHTKKEILKSSFKTTTLLAIATITGSIFFSQIISQHIWEDYDQISQFLTMSSLAIGIRPFSAWLGMVVLGNQLHIIKKTTVQTITAILLIVFVATFDLSDLIDLAWLIILIESAMLAGYTLAAYQASKQNRAHS